MKALCATTGTNTIGVGEREIYRIELDSNVSEIARKEMQEPVEGKRIEWTCKDLLKPRKQKHGTR